MSDDLKKRLAAAKAARAALQAKPVNEADELAAELAAEERALKEEQAMSALLEQYKPKQLARIDTDYGAVILLRSAPAAYNRFAEKTEFKIDDLKQLVIPCVRYPSIEAFEEILKEQPGVLTVCSNAIAHLAGIRKDALSGK